MREGVFVALMPESKMTGESIGNLKNVQHKSKTHRKGLEPLAALIWVEGRKFSRRAHIPGSLQANVVVSDKRTKSVIMNKSGKNMSAGCVRKPKRDNERFQFAHACTRGGGGSTGAGGGGGGSARYPRAFFFGALRGCSTVRHAGRAATICCSGSAGAGGSSGGGDIAVDPPPWWWL